MTATTDVDASTSLERHLRGRSSSGKKLLVPYVTGGLGPAWVELVHAIAEAGADAVEIGLPFSDPSIDGPTIQEASARALQEGANPRGVVAALKNSDITVPLIAMTYYNIAFRAGHHRFAQELADAGFAGTILPDLPPHLAEDWIAEADAVDLANVLMVAPVTTDERIDFIAERSRGFVYAVSIMGTTGERDELSTMALDIGARTKARTARPVLVGFGLSTPAHVVDAARAADGAIAASVLMRRSLDGASIDEVAGLVSAMRRALDTELDSSA